MKHSLLSLAALSAFAGTFTSRLSATVKPKPRRPKQAQPRNNPEIAAWNARVEREKAEKLKAKLQRRAERLK